MNNREKAEMIRELQKIIDEGMFKEDFMLDMEDHEDFLDIDEEYMTKKDKAVYKLDLAIREETDPDLKKSLIKEAIALDPGLIEARLLDAMTEDRVKKTIDMHIKLMEKEKKSLKKSGVWTEDNIGYFWGLWETRPYMQVAASLVNVYKVNYMHKKALELANELLVLCEGDNIGIRYTIAAIYSILEDEDGFNMLLEKFDNESSISMMIPYISLLVKIGKEKEALKIYKKLQKDFFGFNEILEEEPFELMISMEEFEGSGYVYGSDEELISAFHNIGPNEILDAGYVYQWLYENKDAYKPRTKK